MKKRQTIAMASSALALMSAAKEAKLTNPSYTQPFFNPTRSMRVKNKLRRKWYK